MTFDELMVKYLPLIEAASVDDLGPALLELKPETDTRFKRLVVALEGDLANDLEGPNLRKGALMAAKELVNRFQLPEGNGAAWEGGFGSYSEADNLNPIDATIEAPVLVVSFGEPPPGTKILQTKTGELKFIPPEPQ